MVLNGIEQKPEFGGAWLRKAVPCASASGVERAKREPERKTVETS
jgi:hypothetical protein